MEYQVPQFIEVEDKVVGPLTLKQFIYITGAGGLCIVIFAYLPFIFAVLLAIPMVALAVALAFYKINGKPFVNVLEAGFNYYTHSKFFLWKHPDMKSAEKNAAAAAAARAVATDALNTSRRTPKLTRGRLSELAWSLDVSTENNDQKS